MLRRLDEEGSKAGLAINTTKTKVMRSAFSSPQPVLLQDVLLEDVSENVYLDRLLDTENDIKPEIARRGRAGWATYNSIKSEAWPAVPYNGAPSGFFTQLRPRLSRAILQSLTAPSGSVRFQA
ncbi:hypothetical protein ANCCEY_14030 [Ancylostoma ceylanicum]|uniref:Reverse transcriptase domain-containing protein n=1 Tax=Ancylostoma ceylanicum TaxID=53326 RepID=A0A0D6LAT9_9BILA|nr:hypothetical protein ANCCEY_14030 [Ancylostoma ceylanicum]